MEQRLQVTQNKEYRLYKISAEKKLHKQQLQKTVTITPGKKEKLITGRPMSNFQLKVSMQRNKKLWPIHWKKVTERNYS